MSNNILKVVGVILGTTMLLVTALKAGTGMDLLKVGDKAPDFKASGTDGKSYTLDSLTKEGPVFLYFIKEGCPVNHRAAPFVTKMFGAYSEKVNVIGIYNGSVEGAKSWQKRYGAKYTILADPSMNIIKRDYGVPYSPFVIAVSKDGKVTKVLEGLSPKELGSLNGLLAKSVDKDLVAMSYEGAPSGGG